MKHHVDTWGKARYGDKVWPTKVRDELPALFEDITESESLREEITLWDHWLTLLVFCTVIGSEWVLRKLNGLP